MAKKISSRETQYSSQREPALWDPRFTFKEKMQKHTYIWTIARSPQLRTILNWPIYHSSGQRSLNNVPKYYCQVVVDLFSAKLGTKMQMSKISALRPGPKFFSQPKSKTIVRGGAQNLKEAIFYLLWKFYPAMIHSCVVFQHQSLCV